MWWIKPLLSQTWFFFFLTVDLRVVQYLQVTSQILQIIQSHQVPNGLGLHHSHSNHHQPKVSFQKLIIFIIHSFFWKRYQEKMVSLPAFTVKQASWEKIKKRSYEYLSVCVNCSFSCSQCRMVYVVFSACSLHQRLITNHLHIFSSLKPNSNSETICWRNLLVDMAIT